MLRGLWSKQEQSSLERITAALIQGTGLIPQRTISNCQQHTRPGTVPIQTTMRHGQTWHSGAMQCKAAQSSLMCARVMLVMPY